MKTSMRWIVLSLAVAIVLAGAFWFFQIRREASPRIIWQKSQDLPITTISVTFRTGSANDPKGSEGLAYLTGRMIREGGVKAWGTYPERKRSELEDFLFPLASDINVSIGKEQTAFTVTTASQNAEVVLDILLQLVLAPNFHPDEFARIKLETVDFLTKQFPKEDQEELGKAALDQAIYSKEHPYGHIVEGTVAGVQGITNEKVSQFYQTHFTQANVTLGVGGVVPDSFEIRLKKGLSQLPKGIANTAALIPAPQNDSRKLTIVEGPFEATGVHLGQTITPLRGHEDFGKLYLAATAFGKHRSFVGRLMKEVREVRGLNYGAYSYIEDYPRGGRLLIEPLNVARSRQAFTVWARPTAFQNGCFLLRQVLREVTQLSTHGLNSEEFALGKSHLTGYIPLLGVGVERSLGYAIDAQFYAIPNDYLSQLQKSVEITSLESVKAALQKHLSSKKMQLVVVTGDAKKFQEEIFSDKCPIHYPAGVQKSEEVLRLDDEISQFPLGLTPQDVTVVSGDSITAN